MVGREVLLGGEEGWEGVVAREGEGCVAAVVL